MNLTLRIFLTIALLWIAPAAMASALTPERQLDRLPTAFVDRDEAPESIARRRTVIADAARKYSVRERALLFAVGFGESRFAEYVLHDCRWRPPRSVGNCDRGKARSYWQLHQATCPALWELPSGSDQAVHVAAECAIRQLRFGMQRCGTIEGALAVYAGRSCEFTRPSLVEKARWARRLGAQ